MDNGTIIIGIVIIAICVVPFIWMTRARVSREKRLFAELSKFASGFQGTVTRHEFGRGFAIGVDENQQAVFFLQKQKDAENLLTYVNLKEMQGCRVINTTRNVKHADGVYTTTEKLELGFTPMDKNQPVVTLEFYNEADKMQLANELQLVEQWSKIINGMMKKQKK